MITDVVALAGMLTHAIQCFQEALAKGMTRKAMLLQVLINFVVCTLHMAYIYMQCSPQHA